MSDKLIFGYDKVKNEFTLEYTRDDKVDRIEFNFNRSTASSSNYTYLKVLMEERGIVGVLGIHSLHYRLRNRDNVDMVYNLLHDDTIDNPGDQHDELVRFLIIYDSIHVVLSPVTGKDSITVDLSWIFELDADDLISIYSKVKEYILRSDRNLDYQELFYNSALMYKDGSDLGLEVYNLHFHTVRTHKVNSKDLLTLIRLINSKLNVLLPDNNLRTNVTDILVSEGFDVTKNTYSSSELLEMAVKTFHPKFEPVIRTLGIEDGLFIDVVDILSLTPESSPILTGLDRRYLKVEHIRSKADVFLGKLTLTLKGYEALGIDRGTLLRSIYNIETEQLTKRELNRTFDLLNEFKFTVGRLYDSDIVKYQAITEACLGPDAFTGNLKISEVIRNVSTYVQDILQFKWCLRHIDRLGETITINVQGEEIKLDLHQVARYLHRVELPRKEFTGWNRVYNQVKHFLIDDMLAQLGHNIELPEYPFTVNSDIITQLRDSHSLVKEGIEMNHCVGTYISKAHASESYIFHMNDDSEHGVTIEVEVKDHVPKIVQVRGHSNRDTPIAEAYCREAFKLSYI